MLETKIIGVESFNLTDAQYLKLSHIIYDSAGIHLGDNKKELVHARLSKIMRKRNIKGFRDYLNVLRNDKTGDELVGLLDAISTNVTHFFREEKHFDFLVQHITDHGYEGNLRIWSAGCSSGEEPYSIAIMLREHV
ncbi:Chemotaxis protein methyltransferase [subsurface metagenome]